MKAKLLESPPVSGSVDEVAFVVGGDATWVLFDLDDGSTWAGAFGNGDILPGHASAALACDGSSDALVLASGRAYLIDALERKLVGTIPGDTWEAACPVPGRSLAILTDSLMLSAVDCSGHEVWRSERIALDGVVFDEVSPDRLCGKVWCVDGWYAFTLNFDGWRYERGAYLTNDWSAFATSSA